MTTFEEQIDQIIAQADQDQTELEKRFEQELNRQSDRFAHSLAECFMTGIRAGDPRSLEELLDLCPTEEIREKTKEICNLEMMLDLAEELEEDGLLDESLPLGPDDIYDDGYPKD